MQKRDSKIIFSIFLIILITSILSFNLVLAEEDTNSNNSSADAQVSLENNSNSDDENEVDAEFSDATLSTEAGITPDSGLYFWEDKVLTKFRSDIENREKKIAEIKQMIEEGNYDDARKALIKYKEFADKLENEVDPSKKEEARRTAAAIRKTLRELKDQIPEDKRTEFVDNIIDQEGRIATAAEIASKIKDLCETLAKVDPVQYSRTCKLENDAPKWQKDLDKKLTKEQKAEAENFFEVMSQCFEDASQCKCDEISVTAFADRCSVIAPLAAECDSGNEESCTKMDDLEQEQPIEDLLPPHLQQVMAKLQNRYDNSKYDNHMPMECEEAGVTDKKGCIEVMFKLNAPEECVQALEDGKLDISNEREARAKCEEIMFNANAPQECIDAGLKDHKECGKFMFKQNAPQECIDAGITGESSKDGKECQKLMEQFRDNDGPDNRGRGNAFAFGADCAKISDKDKKLECFENAFTNAQNRGPENFEDRQFQPRDNFEDQRGFDNRREQGQGFTREQEQQFIRECTAKGGRWDCGFARENPNNPCKCFPGEDRPEFRPDNQPKEDDFRQQPPQGEFKDPDNFNNFQEERGDNFQEGSDENHDGGEVSNSESDSSSSGSSSTNTEPVKTEPAPEPDPTTAPITGNVIGGDNPFMNYYYK
ncbi:hypothetical protein COU54_01780 [Candidatus Pacearchaeota archaeon CG10_big_fil_rev_8_21_14_0_10_31_24]|nr:MAG: hypothetical protein COU54_01780 [Candidatus Pacearchaeota archaeon CG10_big_fil_rev_8_21_14_0_10_31_24]